MISKSKIEKRLRKKTNTELVKTIIKLKKTNPEIAKILAFPRRKMICVNLEKINKKGGKDVIIPGKVLSKGNLNKKIKITALSFSEKAREKIKQSGSQALLISQEVEKGKLQGEVLR
jgi:large subunit ribosomal protein L18e